VTGRDLIESNIPTSRETRPMAGVWVAALTAFVSGVSVFVNSYGVHAIASPAAYTTAKNLVAALAIGGVTLAISGFRRARASSMTHWWIGRPAVVQTMPPHDSRKGVLRWLALGYVGVVGGGVAFVLFFDGLADTSATPAAFLHDSLVVWVALLGVPLLRERLRPWNFAAIVCLVVGQVAVLGGTGHLALGRGDLLVLCATLLWAVEVIVCKRLLADLAPASVSIVRMGIGSIVLLAYLGFSGSLSYIGALSPSQAGWVLVTGVLLAVYVGTWMTALSRARAVDVTSVLVGSTVVTSLLSATAGNLPAAPAVVGLLLITLGVGMLIWRADKLVST